MARLIDVNKVIDSMQKCLDESPDKRHSVAYFAFESIIKCLKQEPVVDAVEVVRCRECKYHEDTSVTEYEHCCLLSKTVRYNDFCSYGERKDGDGNG